MQTYFQNNVSENMFVLFIDKQMFVYYNFYRNKTDVRIQAGGYL